MRSPIRRASWPLAIICGVVLLSCDKVEHPVIEVIPACDFVDVPEFVPMDSDVRRVLIEDFTAHQCGNCPPAGIKLSDLVDANPDVIVPLAIHAGNLAGTNDEFPIDWTCNEGDLFWADLEFPQNPIGRVNRWPSESTSLLPSQWDAQIDSVINQPAPAGLQVVAEYDEESNALVVHTHITWFEQQTGEVKLALLIAENDIVAPQLWYPNVDPPGPGFVEDYEHKHVLRGSVTGAKGLVIEDNPEAGATQQVCYSIDWNDSWNVNSCDVIAVVTGENGSVLQSLAVPIGL